MRFYKLDGQQAILCDDLMEWALWLESADRRVSLDEFDGFTVSTVFLGLDHNHFGTGDPLLFETMVFCDDPEVDEPRGGGVRRYFTWAEAQDGHQQVVRTVKTELEMGFVDAADVLAKIMKTAWPV